MISPLALPSLNSAGALSGRTQHLLSVDKLSKRFGALTAVSDVTFDMAAGELTALIGPNGAGKTTLFNLIAGSSPPTQGEIRFEGQRINERRPDERAKLGIGRTFQSAPPFLNMTVIENVLVGLELSRSVGLLHHMAGTGRSRAEESRMRAAATRCMQRSGLGVDPDLPASTLTAGQLRLLSIARVLPFAPKLLLLDEPAAGLNETEKAFLSDVLVGLNEDGTTILLVEHSMDFVMRIVERIIVIDAGQLLADGRPEAIRRNDRVIAAYLGIQST